MTKNEIVDAVYHRVGGSSRSESAEHVTYVFECIKNALKRGEDVKLATFGVFFVRNKRSRMGRNPKTGESATISARRVVGFRVSNHLKKLVDDAKHKVSLAATANES
ncbi:MAG: integration host factor subunit alpha [Bradymonadales bacterium]